MAYMLLIHEQVGQRQQRSEAEGHAVYERMVQFAGSLKRRGVLRAVESLSSPDGSSSRISNGKAQVIDGPFAEAKEMVGGFFLVDVPTREEAMAIARECPAAEWATIEVRETGPCYTERNTYSNLSKQRGLARREVRGAHCTSAHPPRSTP
jgi:hypothetical protein